MRLIFSPVRMDETLTAVVEGDVLDLNGEALDFAPLPKGAILPRAAIDSPWIAGDVTRGADGVVSVPIIWPHGANASEADLFPQPVEIAEGRVVMAAQETSDVED